MQSSAATTNKSKKRGKRKRRGPTVRERAARPTIAPPAESAGESLLYGFRWERYEGKNRAPSDSAAGESRARSTGTATEKRIRQANSQKRIRLRSDQLSTVETKNTGKEHNRTR